MTEISGAKKIVNGTSLKKWVLWGVLSSRLKDLVWLLLIIGSDWFVDRLALL
jgi:hypothetical protein